MFYSYLAYVNDTINAARGYQTGTASFLTVQACGDGSVAGSESVVNKRVWGF